MDTSTTFTRRRLLATGAAASAAFLLPRALSARSASQPVPGSELGIGFIGCGKRAFELIGPFLDRRDCRILGVCDVDSTRRLHVQGLVNQKYNNKDCREFNDHRELLAMKSIDAVVISTPDHWHVHQCVDACNAGKDIYCEKPLTLNLAEGKLVIDAVRGRNIVFQTGSQQRTEYDGKFVTACEYVRSGRIGRLLTVHVGVGVSSVPCDLPEERVENGLDWDRWLGPAPLRPYNSVLSPRGVHSHYPSWRLYSEYSGGMMTDFGAHNFDIAHWGMGRDESGPVRVVPPLDTSAKYGARLIYDDGVEIVHGGAFGITFTGESGVVHVFRDRLQSIPGEVLSSPLADSDVHLPRAKSHIDNWVECIRARRRPICDVEVGARSIACAHLCNLAYWHRREMTWDPKAWRFASDADNALLDRSRRAGYEMPSIGA